MLRLLPDIAEAQIERFKTRARCAWFWITECAPEDFRFALRTDGQKEALTAAETQAIQKIRDEIVPQLDSLDEKSVSTALYAAAEAYGLEPKQLFTTVYKVLIAKAQGPRLAGFMKIIGKDTLMHLFSIY